MTDEKLIWIIVLEVASFAEDAETVSAEGGDLTDENLHLGGFVDLAQRQGARRLKALAEKLQAAGWPPEGMAS